jgi:hypothetical protein
MIHVFLLLDRYVIVTPVKVDGLTQPPYPTAVRDCSANQDTQS